MDSRLATAAVVQCMGREVVGSLGWGRGRGSLGYTTTDSGNSTTQMGYHVLDIQVK